VKPNALTGFLAVLGAPLACGLCFALLFVVFIGGTISQLPAWAQPEAVAWMTGSGTEGEGGYTSAGIGVGWDGYLGPGGAPTGIPLEGTPYLNCLYHDPNYTDHTGVDFPMPTGTSVLSTMAGKIVWASENGPWGNLVVVENDGFQIYLAHLSEIHVVEGQIIASGTLIGLIGSTGNSTGPHLHYGIKRRTENGQVWVNPLTTFSSADYLKITCPTD